MQAPTTPGARHALALILLLASLVPGWASGESGGPQAAAPAATATEASPVSATGLLPVFGVAVDLDAMGKPDQAVSSMQKLWDQYLKNAGFNVVQFPVDVHELGDKGAGRLAKLCAWAKTNNVRLAPILSGAPVGSPLPDDYPDKAGAFVAKTVELVGKSDAQAYAQIMLYQIERSLNHPASHGPADASKMATLIQQTVEKVRSSEQAALTGTQLQATPVLASASFDYELIRVGAIAHVAITDDAYRQAYASMHDYLGAVLASAPVDVVQIEWFPGSFSSEAVDRLPDLITKLQTDFPGKLLIMGTGYSSAPGVEGEQSGYYTKAFQNLSDLRTNQGVESSFAGILWRNAVDQPGSAPSPPSSKTQEEMAKWNWPDRAAELTRMWNEPGADSKEMRWWLGSVESHFGLVSTTKDAKPGEPKASYELLTRLKSSLLAAAEATGAGDIAKELSSQGGGKGIGSAVKERLQSALFGMLDAWVAKTAENLVSGGGGGGGGDQGGSVPAPTPASVPDLVVIGSPTIPAAKQGELAPVLVTVGNQGQVMATNFTVYLLEGQKDIIHSNPATLAPQGTTTVQLDWIPDHPGNFHDLSVYAYCDNETDLSQNQSTPSDIMVANSGGGGGTGPGGGGIKGGGRYGGMYVDPSTLGGVKGSISTSTAPGFIQIQTIRSITPTNVMMSAKTPTALMTGGPSGGTSPRMSSGTGSPRMGILGGGTGGATGSTSSPMMASGTGGLAPMSLAFSVSNPFTHDFANVKGTLKIDGKLIATKDLGTLHRFERRTITFAQWTPPRTGTFPVLIELTGLGPMMKVLSSTATDQIVVGGGAGSTATRSFAITGTGTGGTPPPGGGARAPMPQTRLITPLLTRSMGAPIGRGVQTRSIFASRAAGLGPSLFGLAPNSIVLDPFPVPLGKDVDLMVRLFNSERAPANKVKVEAFVDLEKLGETTVDLPIARVVDAKGFKSWKAKQGRHNYRVVVTSGPRTATSIKPVDVGPAGQGWGRGGVAALMGRGAFASSLAMTTADIRLSPPIPTAGSDVTVSVRLQNTGTTDLPGVRAELFVDNVRLGEASADIGAGKEALLSAFPHWKPAVGGHTILVRATQGRQVVSATRDVSVGAGTGLLVKTFPTAGTLGTAGMTIKSGAVAGGGFPTLMVARPDLQIGPGDITFNPPSPSPNAAVTVSITVRNVGAAAASGGSVLAIFSADGAEVTRRQFPVELAAGAITTLSWPLTTPNAKQLSLSANATVSNDAQPANNQGTAAATVAVVLFRRDPAPFILQPK